MRTGLLVGFTLSLFACDAPFAPDAPAIDPDAPLIHITTPERGVFAGNVQTVDVKGTVSDDDGSVTSVTVNDVTANVLPDGTFAVTVPVIAGTNLLHAIARDAGGNTGKETRAVVAGPEKTLDRTIPAAVTASMSAQTFNAIAQGAGAYVMAADLTAIAQPMNPVLDLGGGPDCLYAQARITKVDLAGADFDLVPTSGGLQFAAVLENVEVGLHLQYAASCLDGSRDVTVGATRVRVAGLMAFVADDSGFDFKLQNPDVQLTGFDVDLSGVPGAVVDLLDLDTKMGPVLAWATERFVTPLLNKSLAGLNDTKSLDVLGKTIDVTITPADVRFDVTGAQIVLDTVLRARGDSGRFVYVENVRPVLDSSKGFQVAISDDAANQMFTSLWSAGGLDATIDLKTGPYGEVGTLYDAVEISAKAPPFIDASGDKLGLTLGDLIITFKNGGATATEVALNAKLAVAIATNADGTLRLDVGEPTVYVDILDEGVEGANPLSGSEFEAIVSFALSRAVAAGSGAVGAIPMPGAGGVAVQNVSVGQQTGYMVVNGDLQ
ncbi:MAG: hypothetical protein WKG01_07160 [Kofleriaceae bacterium]